MQGNQTRAYTKQGITQGIIKKKEWVVSLIPGKKDPKEGIIGGFHGNQTKEVKNRRQNLLFFSGLKEQETSGALTFYYPFLGSLHILFLSLYPFIPLSLYPFKEAYPNNPFQDKKESREDNK